MTFVIRQGEGKDVKGIMNLMYPHYFNESGYKHLDYDEDGLLNMILGWLTEGYGLVAEQDGKTVAFVAFAFMKTFYKQVECDVDMFFVHPDYRGQKISRALVESVVNVANMNDAKVIYSSCLSGIGDKNNKLYVNLWKKFGFKELGTCMIRS